ncbi:MAG: hypothetical protein Q9172_004743 [Xanthocarpia lactea]
MLEYFSTRITRTLSLAKRKLIAWSLEFIQLLTDPESDAAAHVFEVSISGKPYAVKAFKYYNDEEDNSALFGSERDAAPLDRLDLYLDPFYNECRAYGKLVEAGLNGAVAVHCYGYMMIPAKYEDELKHRFGIVDWDRPVEENEKRPSQMQPLKAIVKDLVLEDTTWSPKTAKKMLRDLRKIRQQGIYVMDIKPENYKGGLLVDFSIAITKPHFLFDIKPSWQMEGYMNEDLMDFDAMIRKRKVKTTIRASRNMETIRKLRSYNG